MGDEELKQDIFEFIKKKGSMSIKAITEIYEGGLEVPRRKTRQIIRELISDGVLVRVDDVDCYGRKVDDVAINEWE